MQLRHRRAHAVIWLTLAMLLPAILFGALALRDRGAGEAPVRLSPPGAAR